jgi:tRNA modification GTPase
MPASGAAAPEADGLAVSVLTGQGLGALRAALAAALAPRAAGATSVIRTRQRLALETAAAAVARAAAGLDGGLAAELVAEEIGGATRALEALIGKVDVEAILDDIFASFCIGK